MWNCLEANRADLLKQYKEDSFEAGMPWEEVSKKVKEILAEYPSLSVFTVKCRAIAFLLENAAIEVRTDTFFVDKIEHRDILKEFTSTLHLSVYPRVEEARGTVPTDPPVGTAISGLDFGHIAPDWDRLMSLGVPGIIRELTEAKEKDDGSHAAYYDGCLLVFHAAKTLLLRFAALAEQKNTEKTKFVAQNLKNLAIRAPETMAEGMQLTFLFYFLHMNFDTVAVRSLGDVDRLYAPLYHSDLSEGRFTEAQLRELMRAFLLKICAKEVTANLPICIGASEKDAKTQNANLKFTFALLEEYRALDIFDPKIHVMYHENTSRSLVSTVLSLIREGKSSFVFVSEKTAAAALRHIGVSEQDSKRLAVFGCYEPAALGTEVPCTCAGYVNLAKTVENALAARTDYPDFPALLAAVKDEIRRAVAYAMDYTTLCEIEAMKGVCPAPFLSATYRPSVEKGVDLYSGGAKYNNTSLAGTGIATLTDSLMAIKGMVYDEKRITLPALQAVLLSDFQDEEPLRHLLRTRYKKFGCGDTETDGIAKELFDCYESAVNSKPNGRGGVFRCGLFSVDYRYKLGNLTGATADGRHKGDPLSKNAIATLGCDTKGVTALLHSVSVFDGERIPDGCVADIVLHPSAVQGEDGLLVFQSLLDTYFRGNTNSIHFNVLSAETLRRAQKEPERYQNLQIRLCGWNVRFLDLSPDEQNAFILQAENA